MLFDHRFLMSEEEEVSEKFIITYVVMNFSKYVRRIFGLMTKASGSYCDKILMLYKLPFHQLLSTLLKYSIICPSHSIATFIF